MTTLLMSSRHTEDDQSLWRAAIARGWSVERARGIRVPEIDDAEIVIYVEALFAPPIAQQLGRELLDPTEDWLVRLPTDFRRREIELCTLGEARLRMSPAFVKPPNDKSFKAQVYATGAELPEGYDEESPVLVATPVVFEDEFRCFCLDGKVRTLSPYVRAGQLAKVTEYAAKESELTEAREFAERVLSAVQDWTPRAIVLDVGNLRGGDWAVVEANGAWGSGIYGCHPETVLEVIRHATIKPTPALGK